jgi:basic amino acid/polyamine antiporter, APA family
VTDGRASKAGFRRELGLLDAVVVVAGAIIGVGIFANPSNVARLLPTPALIMFAWAVGGAIALAGGFIWAELGSRFPYVGGQYVYLTRTYPPIIGFLYGIALLFIINGGSLAAVSILFATYVDRSFVALGPLGIRVLAAAVLVGFTAVNTVGVRQGTTASNLLMTMKVAGIAVLLWLAFSRGGPAASDLRLADLRTIDGSSLALLLTALVPIMFAYGGWQNCGTLAAEIRDPERNLARANVIGVAAVVVLYVSLNLAYLRVMTPAGVATSTALASDMAWIAAGPGGGLLVALLIVISSLGWMAVTILTGPRLYYAMAQDGVFFRHAGQLHPRYRTPVFALWFQTAVALVLLTTNTYDQLLSYVVFADWLFFGFTAAAVFVARRRRLGAPTVTVPGHPVTTALFVLVAIGIVGNSFVAYPRQSFIGTTILLVAAAAYAILPRRRTEAS